MSEHVQGEAGSERSLGEEDETCCSWPHRSETGTGRWARRQPVLSPRGKCPTPRAPGGRESPRSPEALRLGQSAPRRWETEDSALVEGLRVPSGAEPVVPAAATSLRQITFHSSVHL